MTTVLVALVAVLVLVLAIAWKLSDRHQQVFDRELWRVVTDLRARSHRDIPAESAKDQLLAAALRERFIVTMASDDTFDGLLLEVDDRNIVLGQASTITSGGTHPVDGQLVLRRDAIAYMQRPRVET